MILEKNHANYSTLANAALAGNRWAVVEELIAARTPVAPDDIDLMRLQSGLAAHEQHWDDTIKICTRAVAIVSASSEYSHRVWEFNRLLVTAHTASGQWESFYESQADKSEAFRSLASGLISRSDWATFQKLAEKHRLIVPDDPQIPQLVSEAEWFRGDYSACAKSCVDALKKADSYTDQRLGEWQKSGLRNRLLACQLRLKRYVEAKRLAQQALDDEQDPIPLAIVAAASQDADETRRLSLAAFEETETLQELYSHPQAAAFILQKQFSDLHDRCPVDMPYLRTEDRAVFLFTKPPSLDAQTVATLIKELAPDEQPVVEEYQSAHSSATSALVIRLSNSVIQLVAVDGHGGDWELVHPDPQIAPVLTENPGWLAINGGFWGNYDDQDTQLVRKLGLRLAAGAEGVIVSSDWVWRFVPPDSPLLKEWERTGYVVPDSAAAVAPRDDESDTVQATREFEQTLRELVMSQSEEQPLRLEIQCQIGDYQLGESLWIDVRKARHVSYGNCEFEGVLKSTSRLLPPMCAGLKVRIDQWEVRAGRQDDGPIHLHPLYRRNSDE